MKKLNGRPFASATACSLVFMPPLVRPIKRPRSPFYPQARCRAVRLQIGRIDHHRLWLGALRSKPFHHAREDACLAPAPPAVVQRLVRAIGAGRIAPAQAVTVDEHNAAQHPAIVNAWLAVAFGKNESSRSICSSVSQNRSLIPVSLRNLNQIATLPSMGSDPNQSPFCEQSVTSNTKLNQIKIIQ